MIPISHREAIETWLRAVPLRREVWELLCHQPARTYLVGGSVRDALLSRPSYDLDFAVEGDALCLARQVANATGGAYVPLDPERNVGRVVLRAGPREQHIDLAGLRAPDILADLQARDLTINAMATRVQPELGQLLDPTGGREDLQNGVLRVAACSAFADDPIRVLRVLRLHGSLGFSLAPETESLARQWAPHVASVAPERLRDELFNILALDDAAGVLRYAQALGVLERALPETTSRAGAPDRGLNVLAALERSLGSPEGPNSVLVPHVVCGRLAPFRERLLLHWREQLTHGRRRWEATKLAALLTNSASQEEAWSLARRLRLSNHEGRFLALSLQASRRVSTLSGARSLSAIEVYRFFREVGDAGLDGSVLALAECAPGARDDLECPTFCDVLWANVLSLLEAWYAKRSLLVDPPRLLTGQDLVRALGIEPGPLIGHLLEAIREAQVQGLVGTPEQALACARHRAEASGPGLRPGSSGAGGEPDL